MKCKIKNCDNESSAKGLCPTHYGRMWRHGDPDKLMKPTMIMTDVQRFNHYIVMVYGCWEWVGLKFKGGYGRLHSNGKSVLAHRFSWELYFGEIGSEKVVCHTCDNPSCVNPQHLFLGSHQDNSTDMVLKDRSAHGIKNNKAKLTENDVREIRILLSEGLTQQQIADKFGVKQVAISNIKTGKYWRRL